MTPGLRLTAQECDAVFARDIGRFVRAVRAVVPDNLPGHAFDALVSLCFNIGEGAFRRSTLVRRLKAGDREGAAEAILMWNRPAALIPRRRAEYDQFRTPYEQSLPRARSTDPAPILRPVGATASPSTPARNLPAIDSGLPAIDSGLPAACDRRPLPRTPQPHAPGQRRVAVPAPSGGWARLKASLRALLGRFA